jgi:hypothetical protein
MLPCGPYGRAKPGLRAEAQPESPSPIGRLGGFRLSDDPLTYLPTAASLTSLPFAAARLAAVSGRTRSTGFSCGWDADGPLDPRGFARADTCDHSDWGMGGRRA